MPQKRTRLKTKGRVLTPPLIPQMVCFFFAKTIERRLVCRLHFIENADVISSVRVTLSQLHDARDLFGYAPLAFVDQPARRFDRGLIVHCKLPCAAVRL